MGSPAPMSLCRWCGDSCFTVDKLCSSYCRGQFFNEPDEDYNEGEPAEESDDDDTHATDCNCFSCRNGFVDESDLESEV